MAPRVGLGAIVVGVAVAMVAASSVSARSMELVFENTWGGTANDFGNDVAVAPDGNIYVAGTTFSFGFAPGDALLLKYSADGALVWARTWSNSFTDFRSDDFGRHVAVGSEGVYIAGSTTNGVFLVKFDEDGVLQWQRIWVFEPDNPSAFAAPGGLDVTADGVYLAGLAGGTECGNTDTFLLKFALDGTLLWETMWGAPPRESCLASFEEAQGVAAALDGGSIYVTGEARGFGQNEIYVVRFSAVDGSVVWERTWFDEPFGVPSPSGIGIAPDGGVVVTGVSNARVFLLKLTSTGDIAWQQRTKTIGVAGSDVAVAPDGTIFVAGNTADPGAGVGDFLLQRWEADGRLLEARTWGGADTSGQETGEGVAVAPDGTVLFAGVVASAPPYEYQKAPKQAVALDEVLRVPGGTITDPVSTIVTPDGVVTTPQGETTFAGGTDACLVKVQPPPSK